MQARYKNILVTGGCGFCGGAFVRYVVNHTPDVHVTVLDKLTYAADTRNIEGLPAGRVHLVVGDICNRELLERVIPGHDAIVHFAAESHNDNAIANAAPFIKTNVEGTYCLLEVARAHGIRFHHVSTDEVFGDLALEDPVRFREDSPYRPGSPYAVSKASSDLLVRAWARTYGLPVTISNCCNNYGPLQNEEKFIPAAIESVKRDKRPRLYGDGKNVRDWIHVDDHARAVWTILDKGRLGETYLIGANCERSNLEVLQTILKDMGKPRSFIDWVSDRPGHDRRYAIDASKLRCELGWASIHDDFESGLQEVIAAQTAMNKRELVD